MAGFSLLGLVTSGCSNGNDAVTSPPIPTMTNTNMSTGDPTAMPVFPPSLNNPTTIPPTSSLALTTQAAPTTVPSQSPSSTPQAAPNPLPPQIAEATVKDGPATFTVEVGVGSYIDPNAANDCAEQTFLAFPTSNGEVLYSSVATVVGSGLTQLKGGQGPNALTKSDGVTYTIPGQALSLQTLPSNTNLSGTVVAQSNDPQQTLTVANAFSIGVDPTGRVSLDGIDADCQIGL